MAIPLWLKEKLFRKQPLRDELRDPEFDWESKLLFTEHQWHLGFMSFDSPSTNACIHGRRTMVIALNWLIT
jgi:hypothetical protein